MRYISLFQNRIERTVKCPPLAGLTLGLLLFGLFPASYADLIAIQDKELQGITGRAGISVGLELDINSEVSGSFIESDGSGGFAISPFNGSCGQGLSNAAFYSSGTAGSCRLAIEFANRANEWLVLKDYFGGIRVDNLFLDAGYLGDANSDFSAYDASKFRDGDGDCLLGNGIDCSDPLNTGVGFDNLPAMVVSAPGRFVDGAGFTAPTYSSGDKASSGYDSLLFGLTVGGASIEYGAAGHSANDMGSFLGIRVADNNSDYAGADIQGNAYVFGF